MAWMRFSEEYVFDPVAVCPAEALVVVLHDRDSSAEDLVPVVLRWAAIVPTAAFILPGGAEQPGPSEDGRASPAEPQGGDAWEIDLAIKTLDRLALRELQRYGLQRDRLVLVGIGYGGTLALHMALRCGLNYASVLAIAGKLERALAQGATSRGKVRLIVPAEGRNFGDGFKGEFVPHLAARGVDVLGVPLSGPILSDNAIHFGAFYISELVARAHWRATLP